jgi:hypothetical protein
VRNLVTESHFEGCFLGPLFLPPSIVLVRVSAGSRSTPDGLDKGVFSVGVCGEFGDGTKVFQNARQVLYH